MKSERGGFPRHPRCGTRGVPRRDRADEITSGETVSFRSYTCPACSEKEGRPWHFWTAEKIYLDDAPHARLRGKFDADFEGDGIGQTAPPVCEGACGGDSPDGACVSAPRIAPDPIRGETRGIRGAA